MSIRVAGAQLNVTVGDIEGNERPVADAMEGAYRPNHFTGVATVVAEPFDHRIDEPTAG